MNDTRVIHWQAPGVMSTEDQALGEALLRLLAGPRATHRGSTQNSDQATVAPAAVTEVSVRRLIEVDLVNVEPSSRRTRASGGHGEQRPAAVRTLVLTESGLAVVRRTLPLLVRRALAADDRPCWDRVAQEVRWLGLVAKPVRGAAANQQLVLDRFQERNWASHIADPLPPEQGLSRKARLRQTVRTLNAGHRLPVIRFRADRKGGVCWEAVASTDMDKTPIKLLRIQLTTLTGGV